MVQAARPGARASAAGPRRRSAGAARAPSGGAPASRCWAAATRPASRCCCPLTAAAGSVVTNSHSTRCITPKSNRLIHTQILTKYLV